MKRRIGSFTWRLRCAPNHYICIHDAGGGDNTKRHRVSAISSGKHEDLLESSKRERERGRGEREEEEGKEGRMRKGNKSYCLPASVLMSR